MNKATYCVRAICVYLGLVVAFSALAVHLYEIQITRHDELLAKAREKYTASSTQKGKRGLIYDARGNLLTGNINCRDILAEPRRFSESTSKMIDILTEWLPVSASTLRRRFNSDRIEVTVCRKVDIQTARELKEKKLAGLRFVKSLDRYYPKSRLGANLIGFTNPRGEGVTGIEALMDSLLKPTSGKVVFERDRLGIQLNNKRLREAEARDGFNVYLTIDEPLQTIIEEELQNLVREFKPKAAYALMVDPRTGGVLGWAQYPSFDPNKRRPQNMSEGQWQNRILTQGFEPGSIMKCITLAGALDYNVVKLGDVFDCEDGYWTHAGRPLRDSGHQFGSLRVWQILQKSSNIGVAKIALEMGDKRLYQTLRRFGFGEPTGVGFQREAPGIFRSLANWDGLSVTRFPIGQGILTTPLQIVQAYSALANQGVMMQLRVIDRVEHPVTGRFAYNRPSIKRRCLRPGVARQTVAAMKTVTRKEGTASKAAVPGYEVAGKTGTAEKFIDGTYDNDKYVASFVGFVPADDPAFVLLVSADEPSEKSYYGGTVAAPTFRRIAERSLRYLQVAPATAPDPVPEPRIAPISVTEMSLE
ncbi:MAG: penicillin-binding protein 2 [Lentisphaeria bacterium]